MELVKENLPILFKRYQEMYKEEVSWGVNPGELSHLIGRMGELFCAMNVCGDMAITCNQPGYDVISPTGKKISVKTTTRISGGSICFNKLSLDCVDEIYVVYVDESGEVHKLTYQSKEFLSRFMRIGSGIKYSDKKYISIEKLLGNYTYESILDDCIDKVEIDNTTFYLMEDKSINCKENDFVFYYGVGKKLDESLKKLNKDESDVPDELRYNKFKRLKKFKNLYDNYEKNIVSNFNFKGITYYKLSDDTVIKVIDKHIYIVSAKELNNILSELSPLSSTSRTQITLIYDMIYSYIERSNYISKKSNLQDVINYLDVSIIKTVNGKYESLKGGILQYYSHTAINEICDELNIKWSSPPSNKLKFNKIKKTLCL